MDFSDWSVDLNRLSATHGSGFQLQIEGNPKDPSAVHPGKFPAGCSNLDQVRLLRTGIEALAKAAAANRQEKTNKPRPTYRAQANKPNRPTLSLKKS